MKKPFISIVSVTICCVLLIVGRFGSGLLVHKNVITGKKVDLTKFTDARCNDLGEFAVLDSPKYVYQVTLRDSNCVASILVAYFDEQDGELASYQNRDFNPSIFSLVQSRGETVKEHTLLVSEVVSAKGDKLFIYKWYVIDSSLYSSQEAVKLLQVINKLLSKPYQGEIWLFATKEQNADTRATLQNMVEYSLGKN